MELQVAIDTIVNSLKKDENVEAIFLRGSIARNEHDAYSDIDLYCVVKDVPSFLPHRIRHLEAYKPLIFVDDIFIIAPQILGVYENMLHIDFFTVTYEEISQKDAIKILYDPLNRLSGLQEETSLTLKEEDFQASVDDTVWFMYQYKMSARRKNDIWCLHLLHLLLPHFSKVLLHRYAPERANLGMKTLEAHLPPAILADFKSVMNDMTIEQHPIAADKLLSMINAESEWMLTHAMDRKKIEPLWLRVKS